jgi:primosomal protein N' (replication factor Y)
LLQGVVFAISDQPQVSETREIAEAIDPHPILFPHQVKLAQWIAERYLSSYFDAAALMLPPGFERKVLIYIHPADNISQLAMPAMTEQQQKLLAIVQNKGKAELAELRKTFGQKNLDAIVGQLVRKGLVVRTYQLQKVRVRPRMMSYLGLAVTAEKALEKAAELEQKRGKKQAELLRFLTSEPGPVLLSEARRKLSFAPGTLKALQQQGLIALEEVRMQRDPLAHRSFDSSGPPTLTPAQAEVWSKIGAEMERLTHNPGNSSAFLLHGVTGSGKTEIYLRALDKAISLGKKAIVLVPEIALTPQTISRFASRFPGKVAVLHSKLSPGEQFDEWQRIKNGEFDVVIGSRGAIFAPQPDLGLIVIDEEHEWTYKQEEQQPRYHAHEVAIKMAGLTGSVVIMGSATPDIISYHRAQSGDFRLLELPQRIAGGEPFPLPLVEIVDLRKELAEGNRSIFSRSLAKSISTALQAHEQVILFLNRRGTATFVQCRDCGFVLRCKRCDVSLTYHADDDDLVCHQCNYRTKPVALCPNCLSRRIKFLGIGTQKVEEELARVFPGARLVRWDRDVTRGKYAHENIMSKFLAHEADILIGTQMIAKGLDIPLVTLVGVINADIGLHLPDFHSGERTFQLLTQVAGRAGRSKIGGKVIIQSYTPEHYAIAAAAKHDYAAFYKQEIAFRRQQNNPPFNRLARLLYIHTNAERCRKEAERIYHQLEQERDSQGLADITLIGPSPTFTQRVRGRFRYQIIIRSPDPLPLLSGINLPPGWSIDIDPVTLI